MNLCRYSGLDSHPSNQLVGNFLVARRTTIHKLTQEFDALPRFPHGAIACPADDGSQVLATLFYAGSRQVEIRVELTGCNGVNNGDLRRWAAKAPGPRLLAQLKRLTGKRRVYHG